MANTLNNKLYFIFRLFFQNFTSLIQNFRFYYLQHHHLNWNRIYFSETWVTDNDAINGCLSLLVYLNLSFCKQNTISKVNKKTKLNNWNSMYTPVPKFYRLWAFILFSWLVLSISETSTVTSCDIEPCNVMEEAALRWSELFKLNGVVSETSSGSAVYSSFTWRSVRDRTANKPKNNKWRSVQVFALIRSRSKFLACVDTPTTQVFAQFPH